MKLTIEIEQDVATIARVLAGLAGDSAAPAAGVIRGKPATLDVKSAEDGAAAATPATEPVKKKRKRRTKAEMEAARAAERAAKSNKAEEEEGEEEETTPTQDLDDDIAALVEQVDVDRIKSIELGRQVIEHLREELEIEDADTMVAVVDAIKHHHSKLARMPNLEGRIRKMAEGWGE